MYAYYDYNPINDHIKLITLNIVYNNNNKSHNNTTKATITTSTLQTKLHHANIMNVKNSYVKLQCSQSIKLSHEVN